VKHSQGVFDQPQIVGRFGKILRPRYVGLNVRQIFSKLSMENFPRVGVYRRRKGGFA
jgi:hypothetical protein